MGWNWNPFPHIEIIYLVVGVCSAAPLQLKHMEHDESVCAQWAVQCNLHFSWGTPSASTKTACKNIPTLLQIILWPCLEYERTSIALAETGLQTRWASGYVCSLLWSSFKSGVSKTYCKYFLKWAPLAGWRLPVQHSYNAAQLLSDHRDASGCCTLSKGVTSLLEQHIQKMLQDETAHFHGMSGIFSQCSGLAVKWVMKLTWSDSFSEAAFYPRWGQRNLLRSCARHLNTCLWNPLNSRHGEKLLYSVFIGIKI